MLIKPRAVLSALLSRAEVCVCVVTSWVDTVNSSTLDCQKIQRDRVLKRMLSLPQIIKEVCFKTIYWTTWRPCLCFCFFSFWMLNSFAVFAFFSCTMDGEQLRYCTSKHTVVESSLTTTSLRSWSRHFAISSLNSTSVHFLVEWGLLNAVNNFMLKKWLCQMIYEISYKRVESFFILKNFCMYAFGQLVYIYQHVVFLFILSFCNVLFVQHDGHLF